MDITNGLSDNQVNCIFKDEKGFVWFGTTSGLDRYDGYKFRIFKHDAKDPFSLGENHVIGVNVGPKNKLWIFTHSGVSIYNSTTERFSNDITYQLSRFKVFTNQLTAIKKDADGNFWFVTHNKGVYCYSPKNNFTVNYSSSPGSKAILHSNNVLDIDLDGPNSIQLIYNDGIIDKLDYRKNKIINRYDRLAKANNYKPNSYNTTKDNNGNLWIYSAAEPIGAYCYN
ncbi:MAG TPA: two-component regulator propeller domain-containing protein, partial [Mucilaginibacter sp.]